MFRITACRCFETRKRRDSIFRRVPKNVHRRQRSGDRFAGTCELSIKGCAKSAIAIAFGQYEGNFITQQLNGVRRQCGTSWSCLNRRALRTGTHSVPRSRWRNGTGSLRARLAAANRRCAGRNQSRKDWVPDGSVPRPVVHIPFSVKVAADHMDLTSRRCGPRDLRLDHEQAAAA